MKLMKAIPKREEDEKLYVSRGNVHLLFGLDL